MKTTPVIFLDRDGTINEEVNYLYKPEQLHILPGVPQAIRLFREAGYRIVVVTNQAGIARGYYQEQDVKRLHRYLNEKLKESQAGIDAFYFCPHHPVHGIGAYLTECRCRKPGIGMFEQAQADCPVAREQSWMIGDKALDMQAGRAFGVRTVLVGTGYGSSEKEEADYDFFAETLMDAATAIVGGAESQGCKES